MVHKLCYGILLGFCRRGSVRVEHIVPRIIALGKVDRQQLCCSFSINDEVATIACRALSGSRIIIIFHYLRHARSHTTCHEMLLNIILNVCWGHIVIGCVLSPFCLQQGGHLRFMVGRWRYSCRPCPCGEICLKRLIHRLYPPSQSGILEVSGCEWCLCDGKDSIEGIVVRHDDSVGIRCQDSHLACLVGHIEV